MSFLINPYVFAAAPSGYDPDAADYISRVETADAQALETDVKDLINDLFVGVKADGILGALKASCILAAARTLAGALTPLLSSMPAPTNVGFVAEDYDRKTGLKGNGSKYLNSNRNNNADPQDSNHNAIYATEAPSNAIATHALMGVGAATNEAGSNNIIYAYGGSARHAFRNRTSAVNEVSGPPATGFIGTARSQSSSYVRRLNGSSATVAIASQAPRNANVIIFATENGNFKTNARVPFYSIGENLDLALLDARVSAFMSSLAALSL